MKQIKWIGAGMIACIMMYACYEDKGNYDYLKLPETRIDVAGIQESYSISRFDNLSIRPKVYYKGELVNADNPQFPELKFIWTAYQAGYDYPVVDGDTLAKQINLNLDVSLSEITWTFLFTVYNATTDVKEFAKFSVKVNASLSEGWMVLYERDGTTDVGLIVNEAIAPAVQRDRAVLDIYSASNTPMLGKPVAIQHAISGTPYEVFVVSDQDMSRVSPLTFQTTATYEDLFWAAPTVRRLQFFSAFSTRRELLLNDNKIHIVSFMTMGSNRTSVFLSDPFLGSYGTLAPWAATSIASNYEGAFYDQTKKAFVFIASYGTEVTSFPDQSTEMAFDCNNVGKEFIMSDYGRNRYEYVVTKDNSNKYYLLLANFIGDRDRIGVGQYPMDICPDISKLTAVAAGYKGEIFYYSTDNKVYQFDYMGNTVSDRWSAPAGETITAVVLQKFYYGELSNRPINDCEVIYIATYNESTKNGTVYQLWVDPSSGAIKKETEKSYTGFGKVKTMAWKRT